MVTKINPVYEPAQARAFLGKTISTFLVTTTGVNVFASTGPGEAIDAILKTISQHATVAAVSAITNASPSVFTVWLEGEFPNDTYGGLAAADFDDYMEDQIQALGTVDALALATTTFAGVAVYKADQV